MTLLSGQRLLAIGGMGERALTRYLQSLGATLLPGGIEDIGQADFLLDDLGLGELADRGWTRERIENANPRLVHVSVTPFGSDGPRARWKGSELVASAAGGALRLTGYPDRAPVKEALDACTFHADMVAAAGACAAHYSRGASGIGQHVDVSIQEVTFMRNVNGILVYQFDKRELSRVGGSLNYGKATVRAIWSLADGWCFHSLMTGRFGAPANQAVSDWIDETGLPNPLRGTDWLSYNRSTLDPAVRAEWETALATFFASRTKAEIMSEGRRRGINACVVAEPHDVLDDPHLAARDFWSEDERGVKAPGRFVAVRRGPEPSAASVRPAAGAARPGPLAGVRVLDFAWALVGSITTKMLGDLGATVIKVESRTRPCLSRIDVQVSASRPGNLDDKPWFAHLNTSKMSLSLDMKRPEAREVLDPLIGWADVVVENFSPGTMAKLGLDYDSLAAVNPGLVMVSGSVYGQTGPLAQEWGVDGTGGALSGRTFLTGWPDRDPVVPGAVPFGDVIVPPAMAAAVAAVLQHRRESGRGCHIDAAMYEISVQQMRDAIIATQTGPRPMRTGNDDPAYALQGVYPASGEDRWVAISARTGADADRLRDLTGGDVAGWTAGRRDAEIVEHLQAHGIAAGIVQNMADLLADPQIAARGALVDLENPHLGVFGHIRTPIGFSRDRQVPFRAPMMGEHNREAASIAGVGSTRFEELEALGVFK